MRIEIEIEREREVVVVVVQVQIDMIETITMMVGIAPGTEREAGKETGVVILFVIHMEVEALVLYFITDSLLELQRVI